jgi:hypothetical protein
MNEHNSSQDSEFRSAKPDIDQSDKTEKPRVRAFINLDGEVQVPDHHDGVETSDAGDSDGEHRESTDDAIDLDELLDHPDRLLDPQ